MIPRTADQALRTMVWLGGQDGRARTLGDIAQGCRIPASCLVKLLAGLARARLVAARRGRHGGYTLGRPAAAITLHEVIVAADPAANAPPLGDDHSRQPGLDRALAQARRREDAVLRRTSIAAVLRRRPRLGALSDLTPASGT